MIKSCKECFTKCCAAGPEPRKKVSPEEFLDSFGTIDNYGYQCRGLLKSGKCSYWKSPKLPVECRTHVCNVREFSEAELDRISQVEEDIICPACGREWSLEVTPEGLPLSEVHYECEGCDHKWTWTLTPTIQTTTGLGSAPP